MKNNENYEDPFIPYPIAGSDRLYRVYVPTGEAVENMVVAYAKQKHHKGEEVSSDIMTHLRDTYGMNPDEAKNERYRPQSSVHKYGITIVRRPEDMTEEDFAKAIHSELSPRIGVYYKEIPNSAYAVSTDLFDPTIGDYSRVDANGNLLCATVGSKLEGDCGNVLINGRDLSSDYEETLSEERLPNRKQVIHLGANGVIFPADENGYYATWIAKRDKPMLAVPTSIQYNFIDPFGRFINVDRRNNPINITEDSELITEYDPSTVYLPNPIVVKIPNRAPVLCPSMAAFALRFPSLIDQVPQIDVENLESFRDDIIDRSMEIAGQDYDSGLLNEKDYVDIILKIQGKLYDNTNAAIELCSVMEK